MNGQYSPFRGDICNNSTIKAKTVTSTFGEDGDGDLMRPVDHVGFVEKEAFFRTMKGLGFLIVHRNFERAVRVSEKIYTRACRSLEFRCRGFHND